MDNKQARCSGYYRGVNLRALAQTGKIPRRPPEVPEESV